MQAGQLNERITFLVNNPVKDGYGSLKQNWVKYSSRWANCKFKSGQLTKISGEVVNTTVNIFKIRYCKDIDDNMRIEYDGRQYRINSINKDRLNGILVIEGGSVNE